MNDIKKYYDHDFIWEKRSNDGVAIWGRHSMRVYAEVLKLVAKFCDPSFVSILDVGCGAGAFGIVAINAGYDYTGTDESRVAISLGHEKFPQLELICLDFAGPVELDIGQFGTVTAINSLHCLTEPCDRQIFLKNMLRFSRPNGIAVITTMCGPVANEMQKKPPRIYLTPDKIIEESLEAGWQSVLYSHLEPASLMSPIPNLTLVLGNGRKGSTDVYASFRSNL